MDSWNQPVSLSYQILLGKILINTLNFRVVVIVDREISESPEVIEVIVVIVDLEISTNYNLPNH